MKKLYLSLMPAKILLIEDDPPIAENIAYALKTEGFSPICCETGQEALEVLAREDILLILLDIGLPDMNGFSLLSLIRKTSSVPVIVVTARSDVMDRVAGLESGADDYIVKPFHPRELTARVRSVLRRAPGREDDPALAPSSFPFRVDDKRHSIFYFERPLDLSLQEHKLLSLLIRSPGRAFTRDQLLNMAWEDPGMSLDRTVDAHIKTLRQKLKDIRNDLDPILTIRGVGYALKEQW